MQGKYVSDFVLKMKTDMAAKNPFSPMPFGRISHDVPGKPTTQGVEDLRVQEMVVDKLAREGKADSAKIEIGVWSFTSSSSILDSRPPQDKLMRITMVMACKTIIINGLYAKKA